MKVHGVIVKHMTLPFLIVYIGVVVNVALDDGEQLSTWNVTEDHLQLHQFSGRRLMHYWVDCV
jgi:hypothetical protein